MNFSFPELTSPLAAWLPAAGAVLKSTILLALTGVAAVLLRRASAAARHAVWTLGLAGALVLPALSLALPPWEMPIVQLTAPAMEPVVEESGLLKREASAPRQRLAEDSPSERGGAPRHEAPLARTLEARGAALRIEREPLAAATVSWPSILTAIWLAGSLAILARLMAGLIAVQWMSRRTAGVTDAPWLPLAHRLARQLGITSRLTFLRSGATTMPMAWGMLRPSVLMPADADGWPVERLQIVLLHELAHVKRRDCLTHLLAQLACAAHWFNPLVWIAARHARGERERACDDLVLAAGTRGSDYADQLLQIARVRRSGRFPALLSGATLAMAHRTQLEGRLIAILDPNVKRSRVSRVRTAAATAAVSCAVLPLAALHPWAYVEPGVPESSAVTRDRDTPAKVSVASLPSGAEQRPAPRPDPAPAPRPLPSAQGEAELPARVAQIALEAVADGIGGALANSLVEGAVGGAIEGALEGTLGAREQQAEPSKRRQADPRTVAALTAALKDSDTEVREAAMHALVQLRDPSVYEPLVAALNDASADIREAAAMGLGRLRDRRAIGPLTSALKDSSASVREQAVFALGQIEDKSSGAAVAQALQDASASVREQAAFALGQLRDPAYLDALTGALRDSSASVREQAAFALGQLHDRRAVPALTAALADGSDSVREQAVFALGQLRDPAAIDSLLTALRDAKPDVREQAAFALGQMRDARAVTALVSALKDAGASVREQAAFGLGQIGDRAAVEALVIAMKDASAGVREQAAFALGRLDDPRAVEVLTEALKDASADVRRQAAFALGQIAR